MTTAELLKFCVDALAASSGRATAGHLGPAEATAAPAVALRPGFPWVVPNRRIGTCPEVTWLVQLIGDRWSMPAALDQLAAGYMAIVRALHAAGVSRLGPLGDVGALDIAGTPYVAATFAVTLPMEE